MAAIAIALLAHDVYYFYKLQAVKVGKLGNFSEHRSAKFCYGGNLPRNMLRLWQKKSFHNTDRLYRLWKIQSKMNFD